jgi:ADP-ribosylglycohydrolase
MRSAPIGAYFAEDIERVIAEAKASAEVTHAHPDGQTGAIAVALAAAWMVNEGSKTKSPGPGLLAFVLQHLPVTTSAKNKNVLSITAGFGNSTGLLADNGGFHAGQWSRGDCVGHGAILPLVRGASPQEL